MPFMLVRNDITNMQVDAVVNAANSSLAPGGGVCGAIFRKAGYLRLFRACRTIGHCDVGQAVITEGFSLLARYIIHAVGPVWRGGNKNEEALLRDCYTSALLLAEKSDCQSVAFPLISSGIYGYPKEEALQVATSAIETFLQEHEMTVYLVIFDQELLAIGERRYGDIQRYIDDHYVERQERTYGTRRSEPAQRIQQMEQEEQFRLAMEECQEQDGAPEQDRAARAPAPSASILPPKGQAGAPKKKKKSEPKPTATVSFSQSEPGLPGTAMPSAGAARSLSDLPLDESFSTMLFQLIDEKGMSDVEVYKRANMDRKLFSKLRKADYSPSKQTVIALAIALRLNLDETKDLLGRAGYALSHSIRFDVIIEYFIVKQEYDIFVINEGLFYYDQRLLGA
ncbi:MAG: macro domain-containing protein [Clostridiales bacterium]|nr:macro domain-containing protein [Clostridiales bacterium]